MKKLSAMVCFVLCVAAAGGAAAQGVIDRPQLSAALANQLVGDTVAICAEQGHKVWAVVVNLDGIRQAVLWGDGAPMHSQDNAYYKAYTAASMTLSRNESSTREIVDRVAANPPSTVPPTQLPNIAYAVGGLVIRTTAGQVIGAIGVSGAAGGQFDEACARDAIARIQDQIQ